DMVQVVQVNVVGLQTLEAAFHLASHTASRAGGNVWRMDAKPELGRQNHTLPLTLQCVAEHQLGSRRTTVRRRGIEERYSGIQGGVDDFSCALLVAAGTEVVAAQSDDGHGEARRTHLPVTHGCRVNPSR